MTVLSRWGVLALLLGVCPSLHAQGDELGTEAAFTFPPEWTPHEAVWMGWSDDSTHHPVQVEMIRAMRPHVGIRLMVVSDSARAHAEAALRSAGVDPGGITFVTHEVPNFWTRDPGPLFLSDGRSLAVASFRWDEYGYPNEVRAMYADPSLLRRGEIGRDVADALGLPVVASDVVAEGGGVEVSSSVLLTYRETAIQRNPGVPLAEIEREYLRLYGKEKLVWLSRSPLSDRVFAGPKLENYFGWGANGHIDEFVRFVNDSTLVIAQVDSVDAAADALSAADREILLENLAELRRATDAEGRPFHVVTLPTPALHEFMRSGPLPQWAKEFDVLGAVYRDYEVGEEVRRIPLMGYLNFFVTNGVVLVPAYWREGLPEREREKDEEARAALQQLFPDRRIVQIDPLAVNWSGGGMHCITQQQPRVEQRDGP